MKVGIKAISNFVVANFIVMFIGHEFLLLYTLLLLLHVLELHIKFSLWRPFLSSPPTLQGP